MSAAALREGNRFCRTFFFSTFLMRKGEERKLWNKRPPPLQQLLHSIAMRAAIRCCHSDVDVVIHKAPPPLFHVHIKRIENIHTHSFDAAGRYYMYKEEEKRSETGAGTARSIEGNAAGQQSTPAVFSSSLEISDPIPFIHDIFCFSKSSFPVQFTSA